MRRRDAKQCHEEAAECCRLARCAANPMERSRWHALAKLWEQSAAELEGGPAKQEGKSGNADA